MAEVVGAAEVTIEPGGLDAFERALADGVENGLEKSRKVLRQFDAEILKVNKDLKVTKDLVDDIDFRPQTRQVRELGGAVKQLAHEVRNLSLQVSTELARNIRGITVDLRNALVIARQFTAQIRAAVEAARGLGNIDITIGGNIGAIVGDINRLNTAVTRLTGSLRLTTAEAAGLEAMLRRISLTGDAMERSLVDNFDAARTAARTFLGTLDDIGDALAANTAAARGFSGALDLTTASANTAAAAVRALNAEIARLPTSTVDVRVTTSGSAGAGTGAGVAGAGGAAGKAGTASVGGFGLALLASLLPLRGIGRGLDDIASSVRASLQLAKDQVINIDQAVIHVDPGGGKFPPPPGRRGDPDSGLGREPSAPRAPAAPSAASLPPASESDLDVYKRLNILAGDYEATLDRIIQKTGLWKDDLVNISTDAVVNVADKVGDIGLVARETAEDLKVEKQLLENIRNLLAKADSSKLTAVNIDLGEAAKALGEVAKATGTVASAAADAAESVAKVYVHDQALPVEETRDYADALEDTATAARDLAATRSQPTPPVEAPLGVFDVNPDIGAELERRRAALQDEVIEVKEVGAAYETAEGQVEGFGTATAAALSDAATLTAHLDSEMQDLGARLTAEILAAHGAGEDMVAVAARVRAAVEALETAFGTGGVARLGEDARVATSFLETLRNMIRQLPLAMNLGDGADDLAAYREGLIELERDIDIIGYTFDRVDDMMRSIQNPVFDELVEEFGDSLQIIRGAADLLQRQLDDTFASFSGGRTAENTAEYDRLAGSVAIAAERIADLKRITRDIDLLEAADQFEAIGRREVRVLRLMFGEVDQELTKLIAGNLERIATNSSIRGLVIDINQFANRLDAAADRFPQFSAQLDTARAAAQGFVDALTGLTAAGMAAPLDEMTAAARRLQDVMDILVDTVRGTDLDLTITFSKSADRAVLDRAEALLADAAGRQLAVTQGLAIEARLAGEAATELARIDAVLADIGGRGEAVRNTADAMLALVQVPMSPEHFDALTTLIEQIRAAGDEGGPVIDLATRLYDIHNVFLLIRGDMGDDFPAIRVINALTSATGGWYVVLEQVNAVMNDLRGTALGPLSELADDLTTMAYNAGYAGDELNRLSTLNPAFTVLATRLDEINEELTRMRTGVMDILAEQREGLVPGVDALATQARELREELEHVATTTTGTMARGLNDAADAARRIGVEIEEVRSALNVGYGTVEDIIGAVELLISTLARVDLSALNGPPAAGAVAGATRGRSFSEMEAEAAAGRDLNEIREHGDSLLERMDDLLDDAATSTDHLTGSTHELAEAFEHAEDELDTHSLNPSLRKFLLLLTKGREYLDRIASSGGAFGDVLKADDIQLKKYGEHLVQVLEHIESLATVIASMRAQVKADTGLLFNDRDFKALDVAKGLGETVDKFQDETGMKTLSPYGGGHRVPNPGIEVAVDGPPLNLILAMKNVIQEFDDLNRAANRVRLTMLMVVEVSEMMGQLGARPNDIIEVQEIGPGPNRRGGGRRGPASDIISDEDITRRHAMDRAFGPSVGANMFLALGEERATTLDETLQHLDLYMALFVRRLDKLSASVVKNFDPAIAGIDRLLKLTKGVRAVFTRAAEGGETFADALARLDDVLDKHSVNPALLRLVLFLKDADLWLRRAGYTARTILGTALKEDDALVQSLSSNLIALLRHLEGFATKTAVLRKQTSLNSDRTGGLDFTPERLKLIEADPAVLASEHLRTEAAISPGARTPSRNLIFENFDQIMKPTTQEMNDFFNMLLRTQDALYGLENAVNDLRHQFLELMEMTRTLRDEGTMSYRTNVIDIPPYGESNRTPARREMEELTGYDRMNKYAVETPSSGGLGTGRFSSLELELSHVDEAMAEFVHRLDILAKVAGEVWNPMLEGITRLEALARGVRAVFGEATKGSDVFADALARLDDELHGHSVNPHLEDLQRLLGLDEALMRLFARQTAVTAQELVGLDFILKKLAEHIQEIPLTRLQQALALLAQVRVQFDRAQIDRGSNQHPAVVSGGVRYPELDDVAQFQGRRLENPEFTDNREFPVLGLAKSRELGEQLGQAFSSLAVDIDLVNGVLYQLMVHLNNVIASGSPLIHWFETLDNLLWDLGVGIKDLIQLGDQKNLHNAFENDDYKMTARDVREINRRDESDLPVPTSGMLHLNPENGVGHLVPNMQLVDELVDEITFGLIDLAHAWQRAQLGGDWDALAESMEKLGSGTQKVFDMIRSRAAKDLDTLRQGIDGADDALEGHSLNPALERLVDLLRRTGAALGQADGFAGFRQQVDATDPALDELRHGLTQAGQAVDDLDDRSRRFDWNDSGFFDVIGIIRSIGEGLKNLGPLAQKAARAIGNIKIGKGPGSGLAVPGAPVSTGAVELAKHYKDAADNATAFGAKAKKATGEASQGMSNLLRNAAAGFGFYQVTKFFNDTIQSVSKLREQVNKVNVVFGESAQQVKSFGDNALDAVGLSNTTALEAAGTFGNLTTAIGLPQEASAKLSVSLVRLGADLSSFNDISVADSMEKLKSGLTGEFEPLKSLGVALNETVLKQEALALGFETTGATLDPLSKALATYSLLLKNTKNAQGDYQNTQESFANQQRKLTQEFEEAKQAIGEQLLPVATEMITMIRDAIPSIIEFAKALGEVAVTVFKVLTPALRGVAPVISFIAKALGAIPVPVLAAVGAFFGFQKVFKMFSGEGSLVAKGLTRLQASFMATAVQASASAAAMEGTALAGSTAQAGYLKSARGAEKLASAVGKMGTAIPVVGALLIAGATAWGMWNAKQEEAKKAAEDIADVLAKDNHLLIEQARLAGEIANIPDGGFLGGKSQSAVVLSLSKSEGAVKSLERTAGHLGGRDPFKVFLGTLANKQEDIDLLNKALAETADLAGSVAGEAGFADTQIRKSVQLTNEQRLEAIRLIRDQNAAVVTLEDGTRVESKTTAELIAKTKELTKEFEDGLKVLDTRQRLGTANLEQEADATEITKGLAAGRELLIQRAGPLGISEEQLADAFKTSGTEADQLITVQDLLKDSEVELALSTGKVGQVFDRTKERVKEFQGIFSGVVGDMKIMSKAVEAAKKPIQDQVKALTAQKEALGKQAEAQTAAVEAQKASLEVRKEALAAENEVIKKLNDDRKAEIDELQALEDAARAVFATIVGEADAFADVLSKAGARASTALEKTRTALDKTKEDLDTKLEEEINPVVLEQLRAELAKTTAALEALPEEAHSSLEDFQVVIEEDLAKTAKFIGGIKTLLARGADSLAKFLLGQGREAGDAVLEAVGLSDLQLLDQENRLERSRANNEAQMADVANLVDQLDGVDVPEFNAIPELDTIALDRQSKTLEKASQGVEAAVKAIDVQIAALNDLPEPTIGTGDLIAAQTKQFDSAQKFFDNLKLLQENGLDATATYYAQQGQEGVAALDALVETNRATLTDGDLTNNGQLAQFDEQIKQLGLRHEEMLAEAQTFAAAFGAAGASAGDQFRLKFIKALAPDKIVGLLSTLAETSIDKFALQLQILEALGVDTAGAIKANVDKVFAGGNVTGVSAALLEKWIKFGITRPQDDSRFGQGRGAEGGIFRSPTNMLIGEAGAEVLIPLSDPRRALALAQQSGLLRILGSVRAGTVSRPEATTMGGTVVHVDSVVIQMVAAPGVTPAEAQAQGDAAGVGFLRRMQTVASVRSA